MSFEEVVGCFFKSSIGSRTICICIAKKRSGICMMSNLTCGFPVPDILDTEGGGRSKAERSQNEARNTSLRGANCRAQEQSIGLRD